MLSAALILQPEWSWSQPARAVRSASDDCRVDRQCFPSLRENATNGRGFFSSPRCSVTGPSLTSSTSMCWRKRPVATVEPRAATASTKTLVEPLGQLRPARGGEAGRRPWRQSPNSVNWLTTSIAPPTSASGKVHFPWLSSKIRRPAIFSANCRASASVSPCGDAQQDEHARPDLAADLAGHGDRGAADTLDAGSHGQLEVRGQLGARRVHKQTQASRFGIRPAVRVQSLAAMKATTIRH